MSVCFGKNFCIKLLVFITFLSSHHSLENVFSGLWKLSEIAPSWNGEFSLKSKLISGSISALCEPFEPCELSWFPGVGDLIGLGGA